jgi:hypothetical protein
MIPLRAKLAKKLNLSSPSFLYLLTPAMDLAPAIALVSRRVCAAMACAKCGGICTEHNHFINAKVGCINF